jgi:hypothetical protein
MSADGPVGGAVRDEHGRFVGKKEEGGGREITLHQGALSAEQKEELRVAEAERVERVEALATERLAVRARLVNKQRTANAAAAAADEEHAVMCVLVDETKFDTWVTLTSMVAFMKLWDTVPLQSSGDLDVLTRKTHISAWLAKLFPKMRISAPHLWNLLVYVDYRVRGETLDSYRVDCSAYGELAVSPIFVRRYILERPPEGGVERVRRSQKPLVMNDLSLDQLGLYSRVARNCLGDFLEGALDPLGPVADAIAQLRTFGTQRYTNSFAIFARLDGIAKAAAVGSDHDAMELYHGLTTQPSPMCWSGPMCCRCWRSWAAPRRSRGRLLIRSSSCSIWRRQARP